jgi:SPP1 family predicted phage head-tail adaptor
MAKPPVLRERVRLERPAKQKDGHGNAENGWSEIAVVSAEVKPMRGWENVQAGKLAGRVAYEILIRWTKAFGEGAGRLTSNDRAVNERTGEIYNIRAVEDRTMRRAWLLLTCESGVAT